MPLSEFSFSFSTSWPALGPPSEPFWLLPLASFLPVCYLSFSSIFLPLLLSVVTPSRHPPDCSSYPLCRSLHPLFVFSLGPFSLYLDSFPFIRPTALIFSFSLVCFYCSGIDTCGVTYRRSETMQSRGSQEINTGKRLGGGTNWSVCWQDPAVGPWHFPPYSVETEIAGRDLGREKDSTARTLWKEEEVFLVTWSPFLLTAMPLEEGSYNLVGENLL